MEHKGRTFLLLVAMVFLGTEAFGDGDGPLVLDYYKEKCPLLEEIVRHNVEVAVFKDPRMAASLLRLHFHDCFVMVTLFFSLANFNFQVNWLSSILQGEIGSI